jgi:hypothetical protein
MWRGKAGNVSWAARATHPKQPTCAPEGISPSSAGISPSSRLLALRLDILNGGCGGTAAESVLSKLPFSKQRTVA